MGWTPAALYRYYSNKDDLLSSIRAEGFVRMAQRLEQARTKAPSPLDAVRAVLRSYLRFAVDEPELFQLMYQRRPGRGALESRRP